MVPSSPPAPDNGEITLPRPRLLRRVQHAMAQGPVFLSAPPGYGKSVLLREYVAHHPGSVLITLRTTQLHMTPLHARIDAIPPESTILLDEIQLLIQEPETLHWLAETITQGQHYWLLAGRSVPAALLPSDREPLILGSADLAFTEAETHYLLASAPVPLASELRHNWHTATAGWPLAVGLGRALAHGQTSSHAESQLPTAPSPTIGPGWELPQRAIADLMRRLLHELPPELAEFILVSALPERCNHRLLSALMGCTVREATARLAEILAHNLFLRADEEPGWYRYHDLIRDVLGEEARRRFGTGWVSEWVIQAARWFRTQDDLNRAIEHALSGEDFTLAAEYLNELEPTTVWAFGLFRSYQRWITALDSPTQLRNPGLLIRLGRALLQVGDRNGARTLFARVLEAAGENKEPAVRWEAQSALAKLQVMDGDLDAALALCQEVIDAAPAGDPAHLHALNVSGIALTQLNRFRAARRRFEKLLRLLAAHPAQGGRIDDTSPPGDALAAGDVSLAQMTANLHHNLAIGIHIPLGQFQAAAYHLQQNDSYYAQRPVARSQHLLAWCAYHESLGDWQGLARNLAEIEAAEAQSDYPDEENSWYFWYKALYHTGVGEFVAAQQILDDLAPMMVNDEDHLCLDYARVWLLRRQGDTDVSRETACRALNTDRAGPLYRGMLAMELLQSLPIGTEDQSPDRSGELPDESTLYWESTPSVDPVPKQATAEARSVSPPSAGAVVQRIAKREIQGLLVVRSAPWLLRLRAHLACAAQYEPTANTSPPAGQVQRHMNRVLQYTEQMFFWRILTDREAELGLRFWRQVLVEKTHDAVCVARAAEALVALAERENGLAFSRVEMTVQTLLEDAAPVVRAQAAQILARLGAETSIAPLADRLARETDAAVYSTLEHALDHLEHAPPPRLIITLLGEFQVRRGERALEAEDWRRPAVRRLLQYFAIHAGQQLSRERILDDLWPESPPHTARNTFRTLYSWLRQTLEPYLRPKAPVRYFLLAGETYCFAPESVRHLVESDMAHFEATVRTALAQAEADDLPHLPQTLLDVLENWSPLLPELPYEPWAVAARERIAGLYVEGCLHAAQSLLHLRRGPEAAEWARRAILQAPWLEEAYQALMRAQARLGQRSLALRTYAECADALQRELDVPPSTLTEWLAQRLRQGEAI